MLFLFFCARETKKRFKPKEVGSRAAGPRPRERAEPEEPRGRHALRGWLSALGCPRIWPRLSETFGTEFGMRRFPGTCTEFLHNSCTQGRRSSCAEAVSLSLTDAGCLTESLKHSAGFSQNLRILQNQSESLFFERRCLHYLDRYLADNHYFDKQHIGIVFSIRYFIDFDYYDPISHLGGLRV